MTNYQWIKSMTVEQLSKFLDIHGSWSCHFCEYRKLPDCRTEDVACFDGIQEWLIDDHKTDRQNFVDRAYDVEQTKGYEAYEEFCEE